MNLLVEESSNSILMIHFHQNSVLSAGYKIISRERHSDWCKEIHEYILLDLSKDQSFLVQICFFEKLFLRLNTQYIFRPLIRLGLQYNIECSFRPFTDYERLLFCLKQIVAWGMMVNTKTVWSNFINSHFEKEFDSKQQPTYCI